VSPKPFVIAHGFCLLLLPPFARVHGGLMSRINSLEMACVCARLFFNAANSVYVSIAAMLVIIT